MQTAQNMHLSNTEGISESGHIHAMKIQEFLVWRFKGRLPNRQLFQLYGSLQCRALHAIVHHDSPDVHVSSTNSF